MNRIRIWKILSKLALAFVLLALFSNIYYKSFYFGDASFRLFQGISIGQGFTPIETLLASGTNRQFIDLLRALPIVALTKMGLGIGDIILFNQVIQIVITASIGVFSFYHSRKFLAVNQRAFLSLSFIVYGMAVTTYFDNYILIAGPILILVSALYVHPNNSNNNNYLMYSLLLLSFSLHELSILVFPILVICRLIVFKEQKSFTLEIKDLLLLSSFSFNLYTYLRNRSSLATGSQIFQSEIFDILSPEKSPGVYLLLFFVLLVIVSFSNICGWKRLIVESSVMVLLLFFCFMFFGAQVNNGYPNRWIGVIYRNDLAFSIVITLVVALGVHKFGKFKHFDRKKSFESTNLIYVFPAFVIASSLVSIFFSTSWNTCWDKSLNQARLNGGQIASREVQTFGSCHWDWVDPMTSIIMSDSNFVQNLVLPDGQNIDDLSGEVSDHLMLPYGIQISKAQLQLELVGKLDVVVDE